MENPSLKLNLESDSEFKKSNKTKGKTARFKVESTFTEEIIIGICSPIGTIKKPLIEALQQQLERDYGYKEVKVWKLSDFIAKHDTPPNHDPNYSYGYNDLMSKIQGGNRLREKYSKSSILVEFVISEILNERSEAGEKMNPEDMEPRRVCHIIDSLKNKEELALLRSIYKDIFYMFSVFSPQNEREDYLRTEKKLNDEKGELELLINTDEHENNEHGQDVRNTFVQADFFVRVSITETDKIADRVRRYLKLLFATEIVTPTAHEKAMYAAKSAAGNSACLSRQVGACITDKNFQILSTGWNDVPKFGGNLYEEGEGKDLRCYKYKGYCRNDKQKDDIVNEILKKLFDDKTFINKYFKENALEKNNDLKDRLVGILRKNTPIKDLIEFSRAVHAEMHAIISGSQKTGEQMIGGKLYCTTYPCHNCARHIIASGIEEVYYIEPYVKSLCTSLHDEAITENENEPKKVKIRLYDGVAPRRFLEFFTMSSNRKGNNGEKLDPDTRTQYPKFRLTLQALSTLEKLALESLDESNLIDEDE